MRPNFVLALGFGLLASSFAARADTLQNFTLNETFATGPASAMGSVVIDTTAGTVSSVNYTISYGGTNYLFDSEVDGSFGTAEAIESVSGNLTNILFFPASTLVGYNGSLLCPAGFTGACLEPGTSSFYTAALFVGSAQDNITSGSLTPTPEPSSFLLLGTGLLGAAGVLRKRFA